MKKRSTIITLLVCLLMLVAAVALWVTGDEAPLDYSSMDVEIGPQDATINGYTKLREIADGMEWEMGRLDIDDYDERVEFSPFYPNEKPLTIEEYRAIVSANQANAEAIEEAYAMDIFQFDQEFEFMTLTPEAGAIQKYSEARCIEARLVALEGDPDHALKILLTTANQVERFSDSKGALVSHLTVTACVGIINVEIDYLISHFPISKTTLRTALTDYSLRDLLQNNLATTIKCEFQLVMNFLDLVESDASEAVKITDIPPVLIHVAYQPNATRNYFFRIYLELSKQFALPLAKQDFSYIDEIMNRPAWKSILAGHYVGEQLSQMIVPIMQKVSESTAAIDFSSEVTYLTFALRLYQLEHGSLPPTLEALVPDYIEAVPLDPYDGQPIRYDADKAILYSVGEDFRDDGGSSYPSRFDRDTPDLGDLIYNDEIAERDSQEPTFHIRFDQEPAPMTASD